MNVVINSSGDITRVVSNSATPQILNEGESEIIVTDQNVIDAFEKGAQILYDKELNKIYYDSSEIIDKEKEIEKLKNTIQGLQTAITELTMMIAAPQ